MKSSDNRNWKIEHGCPQCGAPVLLEETDRILSCSFCRVRHFILPRDHFRYFLKPAESVTERLSFVPYWRLKGIVFSLEGENISSRIVDSTLLAAEAGAMPFSLGVRPQVLKLRYVAPDLSGSFIKPSVPFRKLAAASFIPPLQDEALKKILPPGSVPADRRKPRASHDIFVGDVVSLIYTPVYGKGNSLFDAVLQRPLSAARGPSGGGSSPETGLLPQGSDDQKGGIAFLPTLCPGCGWDLQGERDSLVLYCPNCRRIWQSGNGRLEALNFSIAPPGKDCTVFLPFWRLRARVSGIRLESFADLVRLANLPRALPAGARNPELHFWVPAFKTQPNLFLRLSRTLTIFQKEIRGEPEPPGIPLFPVTLPASEALESLAALVASMGVPKRDIFPIIPDLRFTLEDFELAYLPFIGRGEELIQPEMQVSVQRAALRWGRLI